MKVHQPQDPDLFPDECGENARFVTMGQEHRHVFGDVEIDRNSVVLITLPENWGHPRNTIFDLFGPKFCFEYTDKPDMFYFPRGIIHIEFFSNSKLRKPESNKNHEP